MAGATLLTIEIAMGGSPTKLGKCDAARNFLLRLVPELAFAFGLPLQVLRAMRKNAGEDTDFPGLGLATLSSCVREGFDFSEKLALRQALNVRTSRVAVHKKFDSIRVALPPSPGVEDLAMAVERIKGALS